MMVSINHKFELHYNDANDSKVKAKLYELGIDILDEKVVTLGILRKNGEFYLIRNENDIMNVKESDVKLARRRSIKCLANKEALNELVNWLNSEKYIWSSIID